jgi:tryptophan synthase alpha chain
VTAISQQSSPQIPPGGGGAASRISDVFARLKADGRMAFMPFVTAGDPDLQATVSAVRELAAAGVDLIEIGFPYSDPVADGPVIQASYTRALHRHVKVREIFDTLAELKTESIPPLVAMVSYAIVHRWGVDRFLDHCVDAGLAGLIVPDLPAVESADVFAGANRRGLSLVQLVAPTTPRSRLKDIVQHGSGFLYCIAVAGTTGEREHIAQALLDQLKWLREETDLPLAVGFGISKPEHVEPLRGLADGVIVGSAIVRKFEAIHGDGQSRDLAISDLAAFAREMSTAAHGAE